jgi:hypothetical protein
MAEFASLYKKRRSLTTSCQIGQQHGFPQTRHSAPDKTFRCSRGMFCGAKAPEQSFVSAVVHTGVSAARDARFLSRLLLLPLLLLLFFFFFFFFFFFSVVCAWIGSRIKRREAFL